MTILLNVPFPGRYSSRLSPLCYLIARSRTKFPKFHTTITSMYWRNDQTSARQLLYKLLLYKQNNVFINY